MTLVQRLAPRASRRTRLLVAALVWTGIGIGLLAAGLRWTFLAPSAAWRAALPIALAVGWLKGRYVLAPRAAANASRILASAESRCIGGAFSWGAWLFAVGMMLLGITLRHSLVPRPWLGLLYAAVGTALVVAGAGGWRRWARFASSGTLVVLLVLGGSPRTCDPPVAPPAPPAYNPAP
jgi:MFS family permease